MNLKKLNLFVVLLFSLFAFISCSDDDTLTEGEILGQKIQELVNQEQVNLATVYIVEISNSESHTSWDKYRSTFSIDGQLIKVGDTYYNLNQLIKYWIKTDTDKSKILSLSFNNF